jgi:hypothetical protein
MTNCTPVPLGNAWNYPLRVSYYLNHSALIGAGVLPRRVTILAHELQAIRRVAYHGVHALGAHLAHDLDAVAEVEADVAVV